MVLKLPFLTSLSNEAIQYKLPSIIFASATALSVI